MRSWALGGFGWQPENGIIAQVGSVIGKAGSIVKQIRDETGARIRVVEGVPNCDERVIVISARNDPARHTNAAQVSVNVDVNLVTWGG